MKLFKLSNIKYNALTSEFKTYISNELAKYGITYNSSNIFGQIFKVITGTVQNVMLYIEDALTEQNIYTAQRKKSIYGLASLSGYQPSLGKSTSVQLKLSFVPNNENKFNIIINNHQKLVCSQNGLYYNIILPQEAIVLSIEKDNNVKYLQAVQGKFETQTFVSTGGKYYTQNIKYMGNLDTDYISVSVNGEEWEKSDSVYDMLPDGKQYVIKQNYIGGIDLIFGNGAHGRYLEDGDSVSITYLVHDGEQGNIDINTNTYFIFNDELKDINGSSIDGNNVFNVTLSGSDAISSGSNSETTEQVRQMVGTNSRSLVLASPENFKSFINKFSFCGYSRTWAEPGSLIINSLIIKNYKMLIQTGSDYFSLLESDFKLSDVQKESILNCITGTGNQLSGTTYNIFDPQLCKYALYLYVTLKDSSYDHEYIKNNIRAIVGDFFKDLKSDRFIPKSDIIQELKNNLSQIDSVDAYFLSEANETAIQTKNYKKITYNYNPATGVYNKKEEIVYLYDGENPNIGLDEHSNIKLDADEQFPVLMGGWDFLNKENQEVHITDPLIIIIK